MLVLTSQCRLGVSIEKTAFSIYEWLFRTCTDECLADPGQLSVSRQFRIGNADSSFKQAALTYQIQSFETHSNGGVSQPDSKANKKHS